MRIRFFADLTFNMFFVPLSFSKILWIFVVLSSSFFCDAFFDLFAHFTNAFLLIFFDPFSFVQKDKISSSLSFISFLPDVAVVAAAAVFFSCGCRCCRCRLCCSHLLPACFCNLHAAAAFFFTSKHCYCYRFRCFRVFLLFVRFLLSLPVLHSIVSCIFPTWSLHLVLSSVSLGVVSLSWAFLVAFAGIVNLAMTLLWSLPKCIYRSLLHPDSDSSVSCLLRCSPAASRPPSEFGMLLVFEGFSCTSLFSATSFLKPLCHPVSSTIRFVVCVMTNTRLFNANSWAQFCVSADIVTCFFDVVVRVSTVWHVCTLSDVR